MPEVHIPIDHQDYAERFGPVTTMRDCHVTECLSNGTERIPDDVSRGPSQGGGDINLTV